MSEFKYNVGDRVYLRTAFDDSLARCRFGEHSAPLSFMILERFWQECPGGRQFHYKLSNFDPARTVLNIEIGGLFDDLDHQQLIDACDKRATERAAANQARWEAVKLARKPKE